MPASTWTTAAGVAALVVTGAALVAVASTDSPEPTASTAMSSDPTASAGTASSGATISAERARQVAAGQLTTVGDLVLAEIDLELEDGRMIWDVEFSGDHEVEIDAVTAAVLKVEIGGRANVKDDDGTDDDGTDDRGDDHGGDNEGDNSGSGSDDHGHG